MMVWYITDRGDLRDKSSGVGRKIIGQVNAFNKAGAKSEIRTYVGKNKLYKAIPFHTSSFWDASVTVPQEVTGLYIRYTKADYQMICFLKRVKRHNPEIRIVIELPTYPYEGEKYNRIVRIRDRKYREHLHKYVDRIAVLGDYNEVFHIPTIQIKNGIDMEEVKVRNYVKREGNIIHICFVAMFREWHGADRFIQGMADYYSGGGQDEILMHLIGDGPEIPKLKRLSENEYIKGRIIFEGKMDGKNLDKIYDKCDIAVSSLGLHRIGLHMGSVLKSREYLAKGIPFCYAGRIDVFEDNPVDFAFQIPEEETPVDICRLLEFYKKLTSRESIDDLTARIRKFGETYVDMDSIMKPVADFFLSSGTAAE